MTGRFWRQVGARWPLRAPAARLVEDVGSHDVEAALSCGLLQRLPRRVDVYPCRTHAEAGCAMSLVSNPPGGVLAVCGLKRAQCHEELLSTDGLAELVTDPARFADVLARALGLGAPRVSTDPDVPCWLGEMQLGSERVPVIWAPRPRTAQRDVERLLEDVVHRVSLVLVPDATVVPPGVPRWVGRTRVDWVPLSDVATMEGDLAIDLLDFVVRNSIQGVDLGARLWPRYALALDPKNRRYFWGGQPLDVGKRPLAARLLCALARDVTQFVSKSDLYVHLWPGDVSARTRRPFDPQAVSHRFGVLKSNLAACFHAVVVEGLPDNPLDQERGEDGGVRLLVDPARVRWFSAPDLT